MPMPFAWPEGRRAAVSLTYDDGLPQHRQEVAPLLEHHGLRATFYLPINSDLVDEPGAWHRVATAGHELGNHTIFHPCRKRDDSSTDWLDDGQDLRRYTIARWEREVGLANRILTMIDRRSIRSFGNTCHQVTVGPDDAPVSIGPSILRFFSAARGRRTDTPIDPITCDLADLGCHTADGRSFEQLVPEIERTMEVGGWIIYCMHGVGGGHGLSIDGEEHALLVDFLAGLSDMVWTAPVAEVAEHVQAARAPG